jgi:hypothetical protein
MPTGFPVVPQPGFPSGAVLLACKTGCSGNWTVLQLPPRRQSLGGGLSPPLGRCYQIQRRLRVPRSESQEPVPDRKEGHSSTHHRRTARTHPKSNYELFNCNNLNIRYWSWNYRGCWPHLPGSMGHFLPTLWPPDGFVEWVLFHRASFRMGLARPLSQLRESGRRLSVRYDGYEKVALR